MCGMFSIKIPLVLVIFIFAICSAISCFLKCFAEFVYVVARSLDELRFQSSLSGTQLEKCRGVILVQIKSKSKLCSALCI